MKIENLELNDDKLHDLYLKKLSLGIYYGPFTGKSSIDKPWLKYYSDEVIINDIPNNILIYNYMKSKNIDNPNRIAINYYGRTFTYQELFDEVDELSRKYMALGIKAGDIVSICMPITPEVVFSFYALNKLGAICDMIDPRSNPEQMAYYLEQNKSKYLLLCENYYKVLKSSLDEAKLDKIILTSIGVSAPFVKK